MVFCTEQLERGDCHEVDNHHDKVIDNETFDSQFPPEDKMIRQLEIK